MIDPKIAAPITKFFVGGLLIAAGTVLSNKGMKELGKQLDVAQS